jgi:hypothetical protein
MWLYQNKEIKSIQDIPITNAIGFIYKITYGEKFYIGRKSLYSTTTKKLGKKVLKANALETKNVRGRKVTKIKETKESEWLTYTGSSKELNFDIKYGNFELRKEILCFCYTQKQLSLYELKYQFLYNVLEVDNSYNANLLGKYFKTDIIND